MVTAQQLTNEVVKKEEAKKKLIFNQPVSFWKYFYKMLDKRLVKEFK